MIMWTLFGIFLLINGSLGAPAPLPCPKFCSCTSQGIYLEAHCKSFDYIKKSYLSPEQIDAMMALEIKDPTAFTTPDLAHLNKLKVLKLSSNNLHMIQTLHLPRSLEYLNVSRNSIRDPPPFLHQLSNFKELDLSENPISCDCKSLAVRNKLLERGVTITKGTKCEFPEHLRGETWLSVKCEENETLSGDIQGDAPFEGSGSGDGEFKSYPTAEPEDWDTTLEEEFIRVSNTTTTTEKYITTVGEIEDNVEGSGDGAESIVTTKLVHSTEANTITIATDDIHKSTTEAILLNITEVHTTTTESDDYDYYDYSATDIPEVTEAPFDKEEIPNLQREIVKACNFNCSTPSPLSDLNDNDLSPPPSFIDGLKIVVNDVLGNSEVKATTTTTPELINGTGTTASLLIIPTQSVKENEILLDDKNVSAVESEIEPSDKTALVVETVPGQNDSNVKKENLEEPSQQSSTTFIFLGVLLLIIICLIIYAVVKRRGAVNQQRNRSNRSANNGKSIEEEIELIKKTPEADPPNGTHEMVPIMNGHNENQPRDADEILLFNGSGLKDEGGDGKEYGVELRPKRGDQENLLTPEAKRVTIKAGEIPCATPKTPVLITRHVNSDGSVITTPKMG